MNIQVLDNLFNAAADLNDEMIYYSFCSNIVPTSDNEDGVRCYNCKFYKGSKDECMLSNALSILDDAKSAYKTLKNN